MGARDGLAVEKQHRSTVFQARRIASHGGSSDVARLQEVTFVSGYA